MIEWHNIAKIPAPMDRPVGRLSIQLQEGGGFWVSLHVGRWNLELGEVILGFGFNSGVGDASCTHWCELDQLSLPIDNGRVRGMNEQDGVRLLALACEGIDADYMTSEKHHPGYVLIPTAKFEAIVAAFRAARTTETIAAAIWNMKPDDAVRFILSNYDVLPKNDPPALPAGEEVQK